MHRSRACPKTPIQIIITGDSITDYPIKENSIRYRTCKQTGDHYEPKSAQMVNLMHHCISFSILKRLQFAFRKYSIIAHLYPELAICSIIANIIKSKQRT